MTMDELHLPAANQAQIIRASQRDIFHVAALREQVETVLRSTLGTRWLLRWDREIDLLSKLGYYGLATLHASQTLGEEYTDIWPNSRVPTLSLPYSRTRRTVYILLNSLPAYLATRFLPRIQSYYRISWLKNVLSHLPATLELISEVNLAIFYFFGTYHHLLKRILRIRYATTIPPNPNISPPSYSLLGVMIILRLGYRLVSTLRSFYTSTQKELSESKGKEVVQTYSSNGPLIDSRPVSSILAKAKVEESETTNAEDDENTILNVEDLSLEERETRRCTLCLEERTSSCATECGHLFCWNCISGWGREKSECPLCRQAVDLTRLLPIYNL